MRRYNEQTSNGEFDVELRADGSDTVLELKEKISVRRRSLLRLPDLRARSPCPRLTYGARPGFTQAAAGGRLSAENLCVEFSPSDTILGARHEGDEEKVDSELTLKDYPSVLFWIEKFPHWYVRGRCSGSRLGERDHT